MEKKTVDTIIVVVLAILLIGNGLLVGYIVKYKKAFYENPLLFGISEYEDNFQCTCYGSGNSRILTFNETAIKINKGNPFGVD